MTSIPAATPIRGVVVDFHHTLVHAGDAARWVRDSWRDLGRDGDPRTVFGPETFDAAVSFLDRIWEHARDVDPDSDRDLDARRHRDVYDRTVVGAPGVDKELADAMYALTHLQWDTYTDTLPVLQALRDNGTRIVVLSNVGYDLRPVLRRTGIDGLVDGLVMSYEVGVVKPDRGIFQRALDLLGLPAAEVLMVGDAWSDDAAAAALGVRTLILPRTDTDSHGLELVLRLVVVSTPGRPSG
ncbi:MAG: HAD-IA family hydrolase [Actinomycetota bacterium]|nr:HAD-IA family hydrolase [Actinomycetota bacterium]